MIKITSTNKKRLLVLIKNTKIFFCIIFICSFVNSYSQTKLIDSLKQLLNSPKFDTTELNTIDDFANRLTEKEPDSAIVVLMQAKIVLEKQLIGLKNNSPFKQYTLKKYGLILHKIGNCYFNNNTTNALAFFKQAFKIREEAKDTYGAAATLNNIGNIYSNLGQIQEAIKTYNKSLRYSEAIGDKEGVSSIYNNLANICYTQGQINEALDYYH